MQKSLHYSSNRQRRRRVRPFSVLFAGLVTGISVGLLFGLGFQGWLYLEPMFAPPPRPDFSAPTVSLFLTTPAPSPAASPTLPTEAAIEGERAQITEPIGLILRAQPNFEGEQLGGVAEGEIVFILEQSDDGEWDRIRRELNDQEGWVRAGNSQPAP